MPHQFHDFFSNRCILTTEETVDRLFAALVRHSPLDGVGVAVFILDKKH